MRTTPAIAPLTDIGVWVRGNGLEVVLLLIGTVLLVRFVGWARDKTTERIETTSKDGLSVATEQERTLIWVGCLSSRQG